MTPQSLLGASMPAAVSLYEVGLRDGLQNELRALPTADKLRLLAALIACGLKRIELTSFVSPRWIPQLADAEKLLQAAPKATDVTFTALVPNAKGLGRAIDAGAQEIALFLSVSESHSQKNINKSVAEAIEVNRKVAIEARRAGLSVRCYLSTVWGCPFEGEVKISAVVNVLKRLADLEIYQFSLGDTIGIGTPRQTEDILVQVLDFLPTERIALHLHDTRGTALANALVGLGRGITTFDTSVGGLGGCPYAPGAAGNLASEDLAFMLHGLGIDTAVDLDKLVDAGALAQAVIGRRLSGKYLQAALGTRDRAQRTER